MTDPKAQAKPAPAEAKPASSRAKRWLIAIGAGVFVVAGAYGAGRLQGKLDTDAADKRTGDVQVEKQRATGEFNAQRDRVLQLEARRRLHLALLALEERNFGIAQSELDKAGTMLGRAKGNPALDKLAGDVSSTKLSANDDLGATRGKLLGFVKAFDEASPPPEP